MTSKRGSFYVDTHILLDDWEPRETHSDISKYVLIGCAVICTLGLVTWGGVAISISGENEADVPTPSPMPTTHEATTTPGTTTTITPTPIVADCEGICYRIGRGVRDITGMPVEGVLYGYADPLLDARGIHMRIYSRAFIFQHKGTGKRVVFVGTELTMITEALHRAVKERLQVEFPDSRYNYRNVLLSPNHSHAAPGGMHTYFMYMAPSLGFVNATFEVALDGIVQSIKDADNDLHDSKLFTNTGEVPSGGSINRSPFSYLQNPQEERDRYSHDVDRDMVILKMTNDNDVPQGLLSLFGVHSTNLPNTQHLVSSDNMGWASQAFERYMVPDKAPGQSEFIAHFAPASEGDVSPRTAGQFCDFKERRECSFERSTCPEDKNDPRHCNGYGLGDDFWESTKIAGNYQYETAKRLFDTADHELVGGIDYTFRFVNMSDISIVKGNEVKKTCRPAMGYSFAAGAADGPGIPPFTQGETEGIPNLDLIINLLFDVPQKMIECHRPKPILLPTGEIQFPYEWQPEILPLQILRIGDIVILGIPHEVATMAGRRVKEAVRNAMIADGYPTSIQVVVASMANTYASYLTTYEEYQVQRYEGASTIFGPYQTDAYVKLYTELAQDMARGIEHDLDVKPPNLLWRARDSLAPVRDDEDHDDYNVGEIIEDAQNQYEQGDSAYIKFVSGSPRHDYREKIGGTYLTIEKQNGSNWDVVYTDAHFETRFYWESSCHGMFLALLPYLNISDIINIVGCGVNIQRQLPPDLPDLPTPIPIPPNPFRPSQQSNITVVWDIPVDQNPGIYRITYTGTQRRFRLMPPNPGVSLTPFTVTSREFQVVENSNSVVNRRYVHPSEKEPPREIPDDLFEAMLGPLWASLDEQGPLRSEIKQMMLNKK